jgi:chorismate lyase/3-hydroxybenzoate synthase
MTIRWHGPGEPVRQLPAEHEQVLGSIVLRAAGLSPDHPTLSFDMDVLGGGDSKSDLVTYLKTTQPVTHTNVPGRDCVMHLSQTEDHLFGVLEIKPGLDIQTATYGAYKALLKVSRDMGKPHLLRLWNFMPHITTLENGDERYRLFNTGRCKALLEEAYLATYDAPAACALGTHRGAFKIAFLAAIRAGTPIENPRQISAYDYPKDYGADSPVFSRATWYAQDGGQDILFLSGTASIVGHQSRHPGDVSLQTHETLKNVQAVLQQANLLAGRACWEMKNLRGQVFVRNRADQPIIESILKKHELINFTYLHADICRADLLVEIEAHVHL